MNIIVKSAVASALALGATGAFAFTQPSTNSSDLILYVDALTTPGGTASAGVYALDTGISISSLLPGPYVTGARNSTVFSAVAQTIAPSATLTAFLSSHSTDSIAWTLEGGTWKGTSTTPAGNSNTILPGAGKAVFTSPALTGAYPAASTAGTVSLQAFLNGFESDLTSGGLSTFKATESGTLTQGTGGQNKYGFFSAPTDLQAAGSTVLKLFGFTGDSVTGGQLQSYWLGTATLGTDGTLTIGPNSTTPPVPLPAAVWLFGSGLMGLLGVSRRRKGAAAV
jgi:hypothetical protein